MTGDAAVGTVAGVTLTRRAAGVEPVGGLVEVVEMALIPGQARIGMAQLVPQAAQQVEPDDRPQRMPDDDDPPVPPGVQPPQQHQPLLADPPPRLDVRRPRHEVAHGIREIDA